MMLMLEYRKNIDNGDFAGTYEDWLCSEVRMLRRRNEERAAVETALNKAIVERDEARAMVAELALKILNITENDDVMPFPSAIEAGGPSVPDLAKWFSDLRALANKGKAIIGGAT